MRTVFGTLDDIERLSGVQRYARLQNWCEQCVYNIYSSLFDAHALSGGDTLFEQTDFACALVIGIFSAFFYVARTNVEMGNIERPSGYKDGL